MTINRTLSSFLSEQSANASFDGGTLFIDAVNGRVGIGNTAPGSALTVAGTLSATGAVTFTGAGTEQYRNTNGTSYLRVANDSTGAAADSYLYVQNSATTLFVGLPSTGFTTSGLKVAGQAYVYHDGTGGLSIGATNGSGALRFYSGGTTERMRLDSSGNLGINTSSPGGYGSGATGPFFNVYHATGTPEMYMASGQTISGAVLGTVGFASAGSGAGEKRSAFIVSGLEASATSSVKGNLQFWTNNAGTFSEKVRLTASGEWLINTTTDSTSGSFSRAPLSIKGLSASAFAGIQLEASADQSVLGIGYDGSYFTLSTSYRFTGAYRGLQISVTNGTPTATFTTTGDLLIGTTTISGNVQRLQIEGSATGKLIGKLVNASTSSTYGVQIYYSGQAPNASGQEFLIMEDVSARRAYFNSNGGLANYQGNNSNLSDRREKTNFAPAGSYLQKICAIPVQTFNYIDQNMEDDPGLTLGVVAQDVQQVAPELVVENNWGSYDNPKMRLSVYQTDLQYALMRCIQELNAQVIDLTNKVAELRNIKQ
jgi:hypothetical protein